MDFCQVGGLDDCCVVMFSKAPKGFSVFLRSMVGDDDVALSQWSMGFKFKDKGGIFQCIGAGTRRIALNARQFTDLRNMELLAKAV